MTEPHSFILEVVKVVAQLVTALVLGFSHPPGRSKDGK